MVITDKKVFLAYKWVACLTMLVSHIGAVIEPYVDSQFFLFTEIVGRISFPLFVFLMIESFYYTNNRLKHLLRIGLLAVISEVPFDMLLARTPVYWGRQNVCVTLFLGFLMLTIVHSSSFTKLNDIFMKMIKRKRFAEFLFFSSVVVVWGLFMLIAYCVCCDYGWFGIFLVGILDFSRRAKKKNFWTILGFVVFMVLNKKITYAVCIIDVLMIFFARFTGQESSASSEKGSKPISKFHLWFFRCFYPLHLFILGTINVLLPFLK